MQEETVHNFSLREALVFFYKYRRRLVLAFCVPFAIALGLSFLPSPRFLASSVLIVRLGSEYVYQPELGGSQTNAEMPIPYQQDQISKFETAILGSKDLHRQVVESIGVDNLYPPDSLGAFVSPFLSSLDDFLISRGLKRAPTDEELQKNRIASAVAAFDKRLDIALEKESAVINVSFGHRDAAMAAQALDTLLKLYMEKRKQLYLEPRLKLAQDEADLAQRKSLAASKALDDFKRDNKLHSLEVQRANLLAARNEVEKQKTSLASPALDEKAGYYNQQLDDLDKQERKFSALTREAQIANDEYVLSVHKAAEAKAFDNLSRERVGGVRIIQNATVSPEPGRLQPMIILAGFFLSVLAVFGVAAFTELGRSGFLTPEEVERNLNLPVLAVLSRK